MEALWNANPPSILVVDDFYQDPDSVRDFALGQDYRADLRYFKGQRSTERFLWPYLREEFARLLGRPITKWTEHGMNGVFQKTTAEDPIVYHYDTQTFAGAVYLNPGATSGTSFWSDVVYDVRRAPEITDPQDYTDRYVWNHVETVAGLYNRLVIWDAQLVHSASSYAEFDTDTRLVHLFFFDA
jgi:hypothetical protein